MKLVHQLSDTTRIIKRNKTNVLQMKSGDRWVTVFTPHPVRLPAGAQLIGKA